MNDDNSLLASIKRFCQANYENGYDAVVECYSDEELVALFEEEDIRNIGEFVEYYAPIKAHREDIMGTAF